MSNHKSKLRRRPLFVGRGWRERKKMDAFLDRDASRHVRLFAHRQLNKRRAIKLIVVFRITALLGALTSPASAL